MSNTDIVVVDAGAAGLLPPSSPVARTYLCVRPSLLVATRLVRKRKTDQGFYLSERQDDCVGLSVEEARAGAKLMYQNDRACG